MQHHDPLNTDDQKPTALDAHDSVPAPLVPGYMDQDYWVARRELQAGRWTRAVPMLRALQFRYPGVPEIEELLQEAALRVTIESMWADKVQARKEFILPLRPWLPIFTVISLTLLLVVGILNYGRSQRVNALIDGQAVVLRQAQAALTAGEYREAIDLFEQILRQHPANGEARQGYSETMRQLQMVTDYQLALDAMAAGNDQHALVLLTALAGQAPNYRDVAKLIEEIKVNLGAPRLFANAEEAFTNKLWVTAVSQYEDLRRFDRDYQTDVVQDHLAVAYLRAGQQLVALRPSDSTAPKQAATYFQNAAQLKTTDPERQTEEDLLAAYLEGARLVNQADYEQGIKLLFPVYEQRPTYLGGYVAELLYRAYVGVAEGAVQATDLEKARTIYARLVTLGLDRSGTAQKRLTALDLLLTPTPTLPPMAQQSAPIALPVVEATPTVNALDAYRGWILFQSNRNGAEALYLMRADGTESQPAPEAVSAAYAQLYQQQQQRADGSQRLAVQQAADQSGVNLVKIAGDPSATGDSASTLTYFHGTEYDPVWSPDGQWIAFVANHTGNDEIWLIDAAGSQARQLTLNTWEWDKHPSFAPDGQQLVFYSNRTGVRQIWRMNVDGTNQQNLSNNGFEEWDPVWIR